MKLKINVDDLKTNPNKPLGKLDLDGNLIDINGKGKVLLFQRNCIADLLEGITGEVELKGNLIDKNKISIFQPTEVVNSETKIPAFYSYGNRIRLFYTNGSSEVFETNKINEALQMSNKSSQYDFYQIE